MPLLILSSNPKRMQHVPVVKIPILKTLLAPYFDKFFPIIGLTMNTVNSKIPNTRPYSVAVAEIKKSKKHIFSAKIDIFCFVKLKAKFEFAR